MPSKHPEIGRLFMVGLPGKELDDSSRRLIRHFGINNFILFKRNVADRRQLRQLTAELRASCLEAELEPPLIAIDQEGGTVTRLPPPFSQFPDARQLAATDDPVAALTAYAATCAAELLDIGVNMNLAPVLDVSVAGHGLFMERRSLGGEPAVVSDLGSLIISELQQRGIAACAKHYPGLGGAVVDPHQRLPVVGNSRAEIMDRDLPPFAAAMASGVAAIMTSHTLYPALDEELPATLSPTILTGMLRQEQGFDGLVITDDLEMGAIERQGKLEEAALQAFSAGADMLLICHDHGKIERTWQKFAAMFEMGGISADRIRKSMARVAAVRDRYAVG